MASVLEKNGVCVVASFVSPYEETRDFVKGLCKNFIEVHIKASVEACMQRDERQLYQKAQKGEIPNFTGISDVYEEPKQAEIVIDAEKDGPDEAAEIILSHIKKRFL